MSRPKVEADPVLGVVLQACKRLQRQPPDRIEGIGRQMRPHDQIRKEFERLLETRSDGDCADHHVDAGRRHAPLRTRPIKRVAESLTVAFTRAAKGEFGEQTRPAVACRTIGIGGISRGKKPRNSHGAHPCHFLHQKRHTALKNADSDRIRLHRGRGGHLRMLSQSGCTHRTLRRRARIAPDQPRACRTNPALRPS